MRTKLQAMSDRLMLLYAVALGNEIGCVDGTFKLMKIPFMAELDSTRKGINSFHYSFFRWTFGPFTTEIYEDADSLSALGLSTPKDSPRVTPKGYRLLEEASGLFEQNRSALQFVEQAARNCAPLGFTALKNHVYRQVVLAGTPEEATIANVPRGMKVLSSLSTPSASFVLDDDWVDTLWGYFNYSDEELASMSIIKPAASFTVAIQ
jgi:hypothetical protein